jgi:SAM-dependent methyltransferase
MPPTAAVAARHTVTGADYVAQLTARRSDRRARAAFRDLVLRLTKPAATLFDFGCGTGMDARFYAESGFTVRAYDVDEAMCDYFVGHCREFMNEGRIALERGAYRGFLAQRDRVPSVDLVTANFAPLNLVDDLRELFAKFHALTVPSGKVLASVLSPYYLGDLRYRWWWRNLPALVRTGRFSVAGVQAPIVRRRLSDFAAQSLPYFTLQSVFRGLPPRRGFPMRGLELPGRHGAWLHLITCRYMFLLFSRRQTPEPFHGPRGSSSVASRNDARSRA